MGKREDLAREYAGRPGYDKPSDWVEEKREGGGSTWRTKTDNERRNEGSWGDGPSNRGR